MLHDALFALWFFLPAGAANMAPVLAAQLPGLKRWTAPLDSGLSLRGRRLLGDHKTWRGLLCGIGAAILVFWAQQLAVAHTGWAGWLAGGAHYFQLPALVTGPLFGAGALLGDAAESFCKRQAGLPPGKAWFPFDQIDYILGGAVAVAPFVRLSLEQYAWLLAVWFGLHILASYIGYLLGLKEAKI